MWRGGVSSSSHFILLEEYYSVTHAAYDVQVDGLQTKKKKTSRRLQAEAWRIDGQSDILNIEDVRQIIDRHLMI